MTVFGKFEPKNVVGHIRSAVYSVELVLMNKHQIQGGAPKLDFGTSFPNATRRCRLSDVLRLSVCRPTSHREGTFEYLCGYVSTNGHFLLLAI